MNTQARPSESKQSARSAQSELSHAIAPLCALLEESKALYATLLAQMHARRAALRHADFARFSLLGEEESRCVARLSELDRARAEAARTLAIRIGAGPTATLGEIAARLPADIRARVEALRDALRALMEEVRRESGVVRQAAEQLSAHMAGILQSVHSALAHANVYSRGGRIAVGANVLSSLDIRS
jgi:hypothetical protein